jgi:hypothetical protein
MRDSVRRLPQAAVFQLNERRPVPSVDRTRGMSGRRWQRRFFFHPLDNRHTVTAVVLLLAVFLSSHLCAATYYVAKTGNDANPGTEAEPWLTVNHAAGAVVVGDTCLVGAGVYDELVDFSGNDGTAEAPIVFKSAAGRDAVIWGEVYMHKPHYMLDGFTLRYSRKVATQEVKLFVANCAIRNCEVVADTGLAGGKGILLGSGYLEGISIVGNTIHGFLSHGIYSQQMRGGEVTHNIVYDNATYGIQAYPNVDNSEIAYNRCYDNGESGVLVHGCGNNIHHNVCYSNGASGVKLYTDEFFNWNHDNEVWNNTCYDNEWCGIWVQDGPNSVRNNICAYNRFAGLDGQLFIDTSAGGEVTLDHNCYFPDGRRAFHWSGTSWPNYGYWAQYRAATAQDSHGKLADPLFADAAAGDFRLTASSPCIDAGDPTTPFGVDFENILTPQGPAIDMGAYEYHSFHPVPPTRDSAPDMTPPAEDGGSFDIAPNPLSGGVAKVRCSLPKAEPATFSVCDAAGRRVLAQTTAGGAGAVSLDLKGLRAGVYLVGVTTGGYSTTQKLVVWR